MENSCKNFGEIFDLSLFLFQLFFLWLLKLGLIPQALKSLFIQSIVLNIIYYYYYFHKLLLF